MSRKIFVTTEYDPLTAGGAGAVVGELARRLAEMGHPVVVILVAGIAADPTPYPGVELIVVDPGQPDADAPTQHLANSRTAAQALSGLGPTPADLVEFTDFWGLAYWSLTRRDVLGLGDTPVAVRFHGSMGLVYEASNAALPDDDLLLESDSYRLADLVVAPSKPMKTVIETHYGLNPDRVVVSEPPIPDLPAATRQPSEHPHFTCLGSPSEVKGSEDFLEAVLPLLDLHPDLSVSYIGGKGWSTARMTPMQTVLQDRVPDHLSARVRFEGRIPRSELPRSLASTWAVVLPSRFETFCLAAHEVRRMGLPVVLPDLPAFRPYFSEATGAEIYDGTQKGLGAALQSLMADRSRLAVLANAPPPRVGDPLAIYTGQLPGRRHPREQAGLATASLIHLDRTLKTGSQAPRSLRNAARRLLRSLPGPVARAAVKVLPQATKDRFRQIASWPEEEARRVREERLRAVRERASRGEFPELDDPVVSVVVPCYNQGQFLTDALVSIFEQTFGSFEVVVVDDGSDDPETVRLLDTLDLPRIRLVRQSNRGLPGARNSGMKLARGRYLVPLDADDEITPLFIERMLNALEDRPDAAYAHCWAELFGNVSALFATRPFNRYWITQVDSVIGCVLMRREAWEAVAGYDESMVGEPEDWELWIRLMSAGWNQVLVPEPLFRYRKHGLTLGVEGEIHFQRGQRSLARRHPDLYDLSAADSLRRQSYPLLTVIGENNPLPDVAELVTGLEELGHTWGKYVVDLRDAGNWSASTLLAMADALESDDRAAEALTSGEPPLSMLRRWSLHDPDADPIRLVTIADPAFGPGRLAPGSLPRDGWMIPGEITETAASVQRQRPEEPWPIPETGST